ncbi:MAG: 4-oxalocrotonate tautomerase [Frankiales bacterium]|nr:4-oxalocrotonate tautomerase [Frankiales bacterium]
MPLIQVTMVEGRTVEQKHALISGLTDAMAEATGTPRDRIRVAIYEITGEDWGVGGVPYSVARAPQPPAPEGTQP